MAGSRDIDVGLCTDDWNNNVAMNVEQFYAFADADQTRRNGS